MKPIFSYFAEIIDESPQPIVLEIGACDGFHSQIMCSLLRNTSKPFVMHSFEPLPDLAISWSKWNKHHTSQIRFIQEAVGSVDGEVVFYQSYGKDYYGSSSIRKPTDILHKEYPEMKFRETRVFSTRLDTHCEKYNLDYVDFMWIDVQGAERDVFEGGKNILQKTRYIYTEYVDDEHYEGEWGLKQLLKQLGDDWEVVEDYKTDILLRNKRFGLGDIKVMVQ